VFNDVESLLQGLIEKVERRFYGKYRGYVESNKDPKHLGRLRLRIPSVLGKDTITGWALPCTPYGGAAGEGMLFVPEKDAGVWVEFEEGDLEFPVWVGAYWSEPDGTSEMPLHNKADGSEETEYQDTGDSEDKKLTRKIIRTKKGHTIQIEDKDGEELITIVHWKSRDDDEKNVITMDSNGIKLTDYTQNVIEMKNDAFTLTSKVPFKIDAAGQPVEIVADTVDFTKG